MRFETLRQLLSSKLGRCPRCWRLSLRGALAGWSISAIFLLIAPHAGLGNQIWWMGTLVLAWPVSFSALWVLHAITFGYRVTFCGNAQVSNYRETLLAANPTFSRGNLLRTFGSAVGFVAATSVLLPNRAVAQTPSSCKQGCISDATTCKQGCCSSCADCLNACTQALINCLNQCAS